MIFTFIKLNNYISITKLKTYLIIWTNIVILIKSLHKKQAIQWLMGVANFVHGCYMVP